jgi:hypothetical protein
LAAGSTPAGGIFYTFFIFSGRNFNLFCSLNMKMKRNLKLILAAFLLIPLFSGCLKNNLKSEAPEDTPRLANDLIGTWRLTEYCNWAWGDGCVKLAESDPVNIIVFDNDGHYFSYRDDSLIFRSGYRIVSKENMLNNRIEEILEIGNLGDYSFSIGDDGRLWRSPIAYDAGTAVYVRY